MSRPKQDMEMIKFAFEAISRVCTQWAYSYLSGGANKESIAKVTEDAVVMASYLGLSGVPYYIYDEVITLSRTGNGFKLLSDSVNDLDGPRVWELLVAYPEDEYSKVRRQLYDFMKIAIPEDMLYRRTGIAVVGIPQSIISRIRVSGDEEG